MHSAVLLSIESFMVKDKPTPRNQTLFFKVDWCLETDYSCSSIEGRAGCIFRGRKNAFGSGFLITGKLESVGFATFLVLVQRKGKDAQLYVPITGAQCQRNLES